MAEEKKDDADPATKPKDEPKDDPTANQQQATGDGGDSATGDAEPKDKKPLDVNQFLETVPAEFREVLESGVKMHRERKESLVKAILANERNKFTQEYLQERSIDELEALAALDPRTMGPRPTSAGMMERVSRRCPRCLHRTTSRLNPREREKEVTKHGFQDYCIER